MRLYNLFYIVNMLAIDAEFPLKKPFVMEFTLPPKTYEKLLTEINITLYKTNDFDMVDTFEITIGKVTFRIISE